MPHLDFNGEGFPRAQQFAETFHKSSNFAYAYSYATFLTISGHILGRRIYTERRVRLYPNFYTCLVGPSAESRKSTIMNFGINTLEMDVTNTLTTVLGLITLLDRAGGSVMVHLDELSTFLNQAKKDYAKELASVLTTLYDNPSKIENTSAKSMIRVTNPTLSVLSGSTVEWLQRTMTVGDILGGFGNRMTFILGDPRTEYDEPILAPTEFNWEPCLQTDGPIAMTPEAYEGMGYYERAFQERIRNYSPLHKVMLQRVTDKVMKAAMIQAAWEGTGIDIEILQQAVNWGHYLEKCIEILAPSFETLDKQVMALIKQDIDTNEALFKALGHFNNAKTINDVLYNLEKIGAISEYEERYVCNE